jgi:hypothetical protein
MRRFVSIVVAAVMCGVIGFASAPAHGGRVKAEGTNHAGGPPGLAKKGGIPPGLAKRFGPTVPEKAYVAIDPRYDDRAWFLIDGRWVLEQGFDPALRVEIRSLRTLSPISQPPVPLPSVNVALRVVLFE